MVHTRSAHRYRYNSGRFNLDGDLLAESEEKPVTHREDGRKGDLTHTTTNMVADLTEEGLAKGDNVILKNKEGCARFQNGTTFSKFQSGNQRWK
jgi:hypothetical protein